MVGFAWKLLENGAIGQGVRGRVAYADHAGQLLGGFGGQSGSRVDNKIEDDGSVGVDWKAGSERDVGGSGISHGDAAVGCEVKGVAAGAELAAGCVAAAGAVAHTVTA